jgi:hypothetical protein
MSILSPSAAWSSWGLRRENSNGLCLANLEMKTPLEPPPNWGDDPISDYLENAQRNRFGTFVLMPKEFKLLTLIDRLILDMIDKWQDPTHRLELFFLFRSHSAFRVSCQNALSGAAVETYVSIRSCIEFAGYCLMIFEKPELKQVWMSRHDSDACRTEVRNAFTAGKMLSSVTRFDAKLGGNMGKLYDMCIDLGAHPNERSISSNTLVQEEGSIVNHFQIYLHPMSMQLNFAIKTVARVGFLVSEVSTFLFPERALAIDYPNRSTEITAQLV